LIIPKDDGSFTQTIAICK